MNPTIPYTPISDTRIDELTAIAAKVGAIVRVVRKVYIDQGRDWDEAISLGGPQTSNRSDCRRREIRIQHMARSNVKEYADIILFNYPKGNGSWRTITGTILVREFGLEPTNSREVFAVGESKPEFCSEIQQNPVHVVATIDYDQNVAYVHWRINYRFAGLFYIGNCENNSFKYWFAFREPRPESV
jgi:hypothetical protein